MEGDSVVFAVESEQCSDDEDDVDDLHRKEELHQLLSEQLKDDLLDDTMSTSTEEEVSLASTPRHSPSPQPPQADITPDCSLPHDSHLTYNYPEPPTFHEETNNLFHNNQNMGRGHHMAVFDGGVFTQKELDPVSQSPIKLGPPLPMSAVNDTSDVFAGTSQAYANQSLTLPSSTAGGEHFVRSMAVSHGQNESHNTAVFNDQQLDSHNLHYANSQSDISTYSDYFPTMDSNQSYPQPTVTNVFPIEHFSINVTSGNSNESTNVTSVRPSEHAHSTNVTNMQAFEHAQYTTTDTDPIPLSVSQNVPLTATAHSPNRHEQLEILYHARGRQINQLTQQLAANAEDSEKHIRILRHEKLLVEGERTDLAARLEELETSYHTLEESVASTQGQLAAEQVKSSALEAKKIELISRLQAAEVTVNSLTKQVTELTSSDTLSRIRDNYTQALNAAAHEHKQELLSVQKESEEFREKLGAKDDLVSKLEEQVRNLEHQLSQREPSHPTHQAQHGDGCRETSLVGQLKYGCEGCEGGKMVQLVGRVEDLTFQLTTTQEELQQTLERCSQMECELRTSSERLGEMELERGELLGHVTSLQAQLDEVKVQAEAEKKAALEHCRMACLKLHEESTQRLRETVTSEKQRLTQDSDKQIARLKTDLAAVQEQYVAVCVEKDQLETELTTLRAEREGTLSKARAEWAQEQEKAIQEAVGVAKAEWEEESDKRLESTLREQEVVWQKRLKEGKESADKQEGDGVARPQPSDQEGAVREAVRLARVEWLKERDTSLTARVESAVCAAQKLWREQHQTELDRLREHYEAEGGQKLSLEAEQRKQIEAAVLRTKKECEQHYTAKLQEALTTEKQKWTEENQRRWEEREQELIATAHKEWSAAQDSVTTSEVERSQLEWEESHTQKSQAAVQEAVLKAKRHYEGVVKKIHSELAGKFASQKAVMTAEIRQLEEKVASLLKQQTIQQQATYSQQEVAHSQDENESVNRQGEDSSTGHVTDGEVATPPRDSEAWKGLLKNTAVNVKKDILLLVAAELEQVRKLHREEIARTRETTAQEVKQYYIQRLHELVSSKSHDRSCDNQSQSHDSKQMSTQSSSNRNCNTRNPTPHSGAPKTITHSAASSTEPKTTKRTSPRKTHPPSHPLPKDKSNSSTSHGTTHVPKATDTKGKGHVCGKTMATKPFQHRAGMGPHVEKPVSKSKSSGSEGRLRQSTKRNLFGATNSVT